MQENIKLDEINDWGDTINYLTIAALKNISEYTLDTLEEILKEDWNFDEIYDCVNHAWKYDDNFHNLIKKDVDTFIKRSEYIICENISRIKI